MATAYHIYEMDYRNSGLICSLNDRYQIHYLTIYHYFSSLWKIDCYTHVCDGLHLPNAPFWLFWMLNEITQ